ncbi:MAG: hypothetical protein FJX71_03090 [Alphaproteobacteria bacterium]|nr:hypothetical protein [Alphaproteobacteria bacterium]
MKKRIVGLVFLALITMVDSSQAAFGGLRVGANLGLQLLQGRHFYDGTPQPDADMIKRLSVMGGILGFHGGYLVELSSSKMVIGGEVYYLRPGASPTINLGLYKGPQEGQVTIKHESSMGFAATVGMMLNPKILVYVNVGIEMAKFQFAYQFNNVAQALIPPLTPAKQVFSKRYNALTPALGATYKFTPNFLLGVELSSPFFKRFIARNSPPRSFQYKPVERRLMLKISYLF